MSANVFSIKVQILGTPNSNLQRETGPTFYVEQEQFGVPVLATL